MTMTKMTTRPCLGQTLQTIPQPTLKHVALITLLSTTLSCGFAKTIKLNETMATQNLTSDRVYFVPVYSRIIATFDNAEQAMSKIMTHQDRNSFLPATGKSRAFSKQLMKFQPHDFSSPQEAIAVLQSTVTTPMFNFKSVGFPHIEANQKPPQTNTHSSAAHTPYKPYRSLFKIRQTPDGTQHAIASVSCMGHDAEAVSRRASRYDAAITRLASTYNVDPDLVRAVATQESCFFSKITSPVGAQGLMQLMPDTAHMIGTKDAYNPEQNLRGGIRYLAKLQNEFNSLELVLAAYNAGPGNVRKYNGIPPFSETRHYVIKVLENYRSYRAGSEFTSATLDSTHHNG